MKNVKALAFLIVSCISLSAHASGKICWGAVQRAAIVAASAEDGFTKDCKTDMPEDQGDGDFEVSVTCDSEPFATFRVKTGFRDGRCIVTTFTKID